MKCCTLLLSALTCAMLVPVAARADTYSFTLTPTAGGASTVFSLNTVGVSYGADSVFTAETGTSTGYGRVDLYHNGGYAPFDMTLCSVGNGGGCSSTASDFEGTPLTVQSGIGVSILTGNFNLTNYQSGAAELLTIVDTTTTPIAVTPEPSSLVLLGTGLLGMATLVKRRLA